jgi:phospholipid transport system transporter-binding protein
MTTLWQAPPNLTHAHWQTAHTACINAILAGASGIDWAACTQLDSSALALAIAAQRACKSELQHLHPPQQLLELATLHGVDGLLGMVA